MSGDTRGRHPLELKQLKVGTMRMVAEVRPDHESEWGAIAKVA